MAVKKGLGRGLDALIPSTPVKKEENPVEKKEEPVVKENTAKTTTKTTAKTTAKTTGKTSTKTTGKETSKASTKKTAKESEKDGVVQVDINKIEPNKDQPRKQFDEKSLDELADSIKQHGMIQPIVVVKKGNYYEIIAGERRWRAARKAGMKKVPVLVKDYEEKDILKIALIENVQRENLNPIEEARAYEELKNSHGLKQEEIAASVSKSRAAVANSMRLLKLDERVQELILKDELTNGHGRALLGITEGDAQWDLAVKIAEGGLSVRETENLVKAVTEVDTVKKEKKKDTVEKEEKDQMISFFEEKMKEILGSKVSIKNNKKNKGKIEIEYYSMDELERLIDLIQSLR